MIDCWNYNFVRFIQLKKWKIKKQSFEICLNCIEQFYVFFMNQSVNDAVSAFRMFTKTYSSRKNIRKKKFVFLIEIVLSITDSNKFDTRIENHDIAIDIENAKNLMSFYLQITIFVDDIEKNLKIHISKTNNRNKHNNQFVFRLI